MIDLSSIDWGRVGFIEPLSDYPVKSIEIEDNIYTKPVGLSMPITVNCSITTATATKKVTGTITVGSQNMTETSSNIKCLTTLTVFTSGAMVYNGSTAVDGATVTAVSLVKYSPIFKSTGIVKGSTVVLDIIFYDVRNGRHSEKYSFSKVV